MLNLENDPETNAAIEDIEKTIGFVPAIFKAFSYDPALVTYLWRVYKRLVFQSGPISQPIKTMMLHMVVRSYSQCSRCLEDHRRMMIANGVRGELANLIDTDVTKTDLDDRTRNLLLLAYYSGNPGSDDTVRRGCMNALSKHEVIETLLLSNVSRGLQDILHTLDLPH